MDYNSITETIESVIQNSFLSRKQQDLLNSQLSIVKKRISDKKIYLGIVGEFSSGKSTLINSFIGKDFLRTNSLQGTTTTITKLEYGKKVNLKLELASGKILVYNRDKTELMKLYLADVYNSLSGWEKIKIRISDFFHLSCYNKYLLDVFDKTTTSDEFSKSLNDVTVYHPSEILREGLVIVDTPGTDSLNPKHAKTTKRAINDICDIALIITTAKHIMPQTLISYIDENLGDVADKCLYIITKIELIQKAIERIHIKKVVSQRIKNFLGVEDPQVILAPSMLSLEEKGVLSKSELTDHLSSEERETLCSDFDADIKLIIDNIYNNREETIHNKIGRLIMSLRENLQLEIETKEDELKKDLSETKMMRVKPLKDFMDEFYASHTVCQYSYLASLIVNSAYSNRARFKNFVMGKINGGSTKDEVQSTMERPSVIAMGNQCFSNCYVDFHNVLSNTLSSYIENFNGFKDSFVKAFSIDAVDFTYSIMNKPEWQREYDFNYDRSNLTTFRLFRMFVPLNTIKEQMKNDVGPQIDYEFEKMVNHYLSYAKKAHDDIEKQMKNVKSIFINKYEKIIAQRIKESDEKEKLLNSQLELLKNNLIIISQLSV